MSLFKMRSAIVLIVAGLATAAPHPQGLDWQEIEVGHLL